MAEKEKFAQIGYLTVTESAANTLTFNGLSVFSNVLGQKGMIIHRVAYSFAESILALFASSADGLAFGLSGTDAMSAIALNDPEVYDYQFISRRDFGTAANGHVWEVPITKDFTSLPGRGMLVPADRLFGFIQGLNMGGAAGITIRFWYTIMDMNPSDYLELAQSMRVLK